MAITAFYWGIISAIALPIGAFLGLWLRPGRKINSIFMAFGGGALLFALTIELFGHVPHHVESHGKAVIWVVFICAAIGGMMFSGLNAILNNYGAFMRRFSSARNFIERIKYKRSEILIEKLGRMKVLKELSPELMADLIHEIETKSFKNGEYICRQGEEAYEMFFIVGGDVDIVHHEGKDEKRVATLGMFDSFGELGVLSGYPRTADAIAKGSVQLYSISRKDFDALIEKDKTVHDKIMRLAASRINDLSMKTETELNEDWHNETMKFLDKEQVAVTTEEIQSEGHARSHGNAALAIWMGIFIDAIPESLVIGMLAVSPTGISLAFIVGVFLANMPEAMSSSVSMRDNGLSLPKIYLMWGSITLVTGLGAALGAVIFPPDPIGGMYYFMVGIEALAAGAMLTMIAETMLPEAFEMGGSVVGLSTLAGFMAALLVKII
ncbi:MAG: CRP-like cAMP-binding protein [Gammaproteobacteria bacterium]|jgi:CRP-like cAMP-binding protein